MPESCPICGHAPLDASEFKPNKGLRTTIKAFLRTEQSKRNKVAGTSIVQSVEQDQTNAAAVPVADVTLAKEEPAQDDMIVDVLSAEDTVQDNTDSTAAQLYVAEV